MSLDISDLLNLFWFWNLLVCIKYKRSFKGVSGSLSLVSTMV